MTTIGTAYNPPVGGDDFDIDFNANDYIENNNKTLSVFEADELYAGLGDGTYGSSIDIGIRAGEFRQGDFSVAIGRSAAQADQNDYAIAIGEESGFQNQGEAAISVGRQAGYVNQGNSSIAFGSNAGMHDQNIECIALGKNAGENNQGLPNSIGTIGNAIAIGKGAGRYNMYNNSIAIGNQAGIWNCGYSGADVGGDSDINGDAICIQTSQLAVGAIDEVRYAPRSIYIGYKTGYNTDKDCIYIGTLAGGSNTRDFYTGTRPLRRNICIGVSAGVKGVSKVSGDANTSQNDNICIGYASGGTLGTTRLGSDNIAYGYEAMRYGNDGGDDSICIGAKTGRDAIVGDRCILIGSEVGINGCGNNTIAIGYQHGQGGSLGSNNIILGNKNMPSGGVDVVANDGFYVGYVESQTITTPPATDHGSMWYNITTKEIVHSDLPFD